MSVQPETTANTEEQIDSLCMSDWAGLHLLSLPFALAGSSCLCRKLVSVFHYLRRGHFNSDT